MDGRYFNAVSYFDATVRAASGDTFYQRPMTLTKFGLPDWRPGMPATGSAESPAQHRFPVWWTGDGVPLQGSVESMVDGGVHGFKPYVHSDCGGDCACARVCVRVRASTVGRCGSVCVCAPLHACVT
jgi:hypothetical protein